MNLENDFIKDIYGEGKERWFKIRILDYEKTLKTLTMYNNKEKEEERGFEVISIGLKDEFIPQISAMMDLKDVIERQCKELNDIFKSKIEEVKSRTIQNKEA